jgi:hypothetical protein
MARGGQIFLIQRGQNFQSDIGAGQGDFRPCGTDYIQT